MHKKCKYAYNSVKSLKLKLIFKNMLKFVECMQRTGLLGTSRMSVSNESTEYIEIPFCALI